MNRSFDERLELQLQEYEFAGPDSLQPACPLLRIQPEQEDFTFAMEAVVNRH